MKWLILIVLMQAPDDIRFEEKRFASEAECIAAARAFVTRYPVFDWRDPSDKSAVTHPVYRSYVQCVPAPEE